MPDVTVQDLIRQEAQKVGVPPDVALAVAEQESGFNPGAKSPKGALGVMQLMPETAKKYGVDPSNPIENIQGGVKHLRYLFDTYKGDLPKILTAYNAGEAAATGGALPAETQAYVPGVLNRLKKFQQTTPALSATVSVDPNHPAAGLDPDKSKSTKTAPPNLTKLPQHLVETSLAGVKRAAGGVKQAITGVGEGGRTRGVRNILEGSLEASAPVTVPLTVATLAVDPLETLTALGLSYGGAGVAEGLTKRLGASPDTAALVGDIAGFLTPELGRGALRLGSELSGQSASQIITQMAERAHLEDVNQRHDLHLSAPELAGQTPGGRVARQLQKAATMTIGGGAVQAAQRSAGERNALRALDEAVRQVGTRASTESAGQSAEQGLLAAREGRRAIGKQVEVAKDAANPVDLVNPAKGQPRGVKQEIERIFGEDVLPDLLDHPAAAKTAEAERLLTQFAKDGSPIFGPYGTLTDSAKQIFKALPTGTREAPFAPFTQELKDLYFGQDIRRFTSVAKSRDQMFAFGKGGDPYFAKNKQVALSRHISNLLTDHLHDTSPQYAAAAKAYAAASNIIGNESALMTRMLSQIRAKPSTGVEYVAQGPEYARKFRQALLGVGSKSPQKDQAKAAYNVVRATLFHDQILNGRDGRPDLAGMGKRIDEHAPLLKELYGDADGQRLLRVGRDIADAYATHVQSFQRSMYLVFTFGRVLAGGSPASLIQTEAASSFITWLMYHPKLADYFVHGVTTGPTMTRTISGLQRIGQAYAAHLGTVAMQRQQRQTQKAAAQ